MAKEGNTPCYSASALYFAQEYAESYQKDVEYVDSCGPNDFAGYSIHQLEPITAMLKAEPVRAMSVGTAAFPGGDRGICGREKGQNRHCSGRERHSA